MLKIILITFISCLAYTLCGQYEGGKMIPDSSFKVIPDFNDNSFKLASTITISDLKDHVYTLSSDEYEGRETGTQGNTKAAEYISKQFEHLKLPKTIGTGDYYQAVDFTFTSWKKIKFKAGNVKLKHLRDFVAFPHLSFNSNVEANEIVFLGYGIDDVAYSDYKNQDVAGKVVMVYDQEPVDQNNLSLITGTEELSKWSVDWTEKSKAAKRHNARMLIIVSNDLSGLIGANRPILINRMTQLGNFGDYEPDGTNTIFLSSTKALEILGPQSGQIIRARNTLLSDTNTPVIAKIPIEVSADFEVKRNVLLGQNILGLIEGSEKKEEVLIVSAHYDHVGKKAGEVYNGADDNASGTATVLEIAEAVETAKRMGIGPKRSVLCLLVTGEEKGLLGSEFYAANPLFPIEKTIADVNIDMVGRWGKEYEMQEEPYIYVIGSDRLSQDLHDINESVNKQYSALLFDYKYNDEKDPNRFYYRSDHYNFAKHGIPSIFFFNGVHSDYHRISDTADKIDFGLMTKRARHIFQLVWELANRDERVKLTPGRQASP